MKCKCTDGGESCGSRPGRHTEVEADRLSNMALLAADATSAALRLPALLPCIAASPDELCDGADAHLSLTARRTELCNQFA